MPLFTAKIRVTLRPSILDPQGKAVEHAIASLGTARVSGVRIGKYIEARIDAPNEAEARGAAEDVCKRLLANPVMEDFTCEIAKGA